MTRELDRSDSVIFLVVFIFFIILSAFMLLNMLIGVLHEVVTQETHNEKEKNAIEYVKNTIAYVISKGDDDAPKSTKRLLSPEKGTSTRTSKKSGTSKKSFEPT